MKIKYTESDNYIKYYLYEYLASYIRDRSKFKNAREYKNFVAKNILDYLHINCTVNKAYPLLFILSKLQVLCSLFIVFLYFTKYSIKHLFTRREWILNKDVVIDLIGTPELLKKAEFPTDNLIIVRFPNKQKYFDESYSSVCLLNLVSVGDLLNSLRLSAKLIIVQYRKYHKRDLLFRNYASFDFFLACLFFGGMDISNRIVFYSTYDRWAYLFASLSNYKIFVQHGYIPRTFICKSIGSVDECYCLSEEQKECCIGLLFNNIPPKQFIIKGFSFSSEEKLISNGKIHVLIIGNHLFQEQQESTIELLNKSNSPVNIYVKPHPLDDINIYLRIVGCYKSFVLLEKGDYPPVDVVISYESTLAFEYMSLGVPALFYDDKNFRKKIELLSNGIIEN